MVQVGLPHAHTPRRRDLVFLAASATTTTTTPPPRWPCLELPGVHPGRRCEPLRLLGRAQASRLQGVGFWQPAGLPFKASWLKRCGLTAEPVLADREGEIG